MKYVRQIGIIWGMTMAGEFLNFLLPFPVPAGVYGLFLLLGALLTGVVKIESVEATGNFLMDIMSMMFIPATVGLVEYAQQIGEILVPYTVIIACSTVAVMAATGRLAQVMIERQDDSADSGTVSIFWAGFKHRYLFGRLGFKEEDGTCHLKSPSGVLCADYFLPFRGRNEL